MGYDAVYVGVISGLLASIQGPCSPRRGLPWLRRWRHK